MKKTKNKNNSLAGKRILLVHMDDPYGVPEKAIGTVDFVDDAGQIHVTWDSGSSLALIPAVDEFLFIDDEEIKED